MTQNAKEICKNILIALLICSLLLLASAALPTQSVRNIPWLSRLVQPIAPLLGLTEAELTHVEEAAIVTDAAQPIAISIKNEDGRHTILWDFAALDAGFDTFSGLLAQAINHSDSFMAVSQVQVQTALSGDSVLLRYDAPLPATLLASWLDADLRAALPETDTCILSAQKDHITLYMLGKQSYAAKTALPADALLTLTQTYEPNGSAFAYENGWDLEPLTLLPGVKPAVPAVTVSNPCDSRYINALATALGFNPYAETRYTDDLGTTHFSETNASLEITKDGLISLHCDGDRYTAAGIQPEALAEAARLLTAQMLDGVPGEGRLYLSSMTRTGDNTVCGFDYYVCGVPVEAPNAAATVRFTGSRVTEISLQLYAFSGTGKTLYPLPIAQAMAVLPAGRRLELAYCIDADLTLSAGWSR